MVEEIEKAGGKVTCFSSNNNIQLFLKFLKIIKYCKANKIQVIHAHLPWAGFVSRLVFKITKVPTIYTEHNLQDRYHFITRTINKFSFNSQSLAVGVSEDVTNSIKKHIGPKIKCKTILNGVNTFSFQRDATLKNDDLIKQFNLSNDSFIVGTCAVFRFQKRLDKWLEIMAAAIDVNPNIKGIIVGDGPLKPDLLAKFEMLNLDGKVFFVGLKTDVKPYYNVMDVFMMTSSFEGLPIALLEAMSMGCSIVSTNAGGVKEVIRTNEDGILVDIDSWDKLSDSILMLANDPQKVIVYKQNARKRVVENFSIVSMVKELEMCYKEYAL